VPGNKIPEFQGESHEFTRTGRARVHSCRMGQQALRLQAAEVCREDCGNFVYLVQAGKPTHLSG
jgi:hypothetical protein